MKSKQHSTWHIENSHCSYHYLSCPSHLTASTFKSHGLIPGLLLAVLLMPSFSVIDLRKPDYTHRPIHHPKILFRWWQYCAHKPSVLTHSFELLKLPISYPHVRFSIFSHYVTTHSHSAPLKESTAPISQICPGLFCHRFIHTLSTVLSLPSFYQNDIQP